MIDVLLVYYKIINVYHGPKEVEVVKWIRENQTEWLFSYPR